ncbi:MAG: hypothetical protein ACYTEQ_28760 [Planctomycetota bacterium]
MARQCGPALTLTRPAGDISQVTADRLAEVLEDARQSAQVDENWRRTRMVEALS